MDPNLFSSEERAWFSRVESAAGNRRQAIYAALLDEPIGMEPRLYVLGRLLAHNGRGRAFAKQQMAITLLNHPRFEVPEGTDGEELIQNALSIPMLDIIPVLHARGFRMTSRPMYTSLMLTHLSNGRWPYPDLLDPDILDSDSGNIRALTTSIFAKPATLREEFLRKLVSLPTHENDWVRKMHDGYLHSCSGGNIQEIIDTKQMNRAQIVSSLAVLHTRGWLRQDLLEKAIKKNSYLEATSWLGFARDLLHEVVAHELQQATPKMTGGHGPVRRI